MKLLLKLLPLLCISLYVNAQDLSEGLLVNDLNLHPMQAIAKPAYLDYIIDPSFGTTIRRITDAGVGGVIVPMYSTIQAWNADESLMILYNQSESEHQMFDGKTYAYIRDLDDVNPDDLEQIFWDFNDPDVFYYPEASTDDFIKYTVSTQSKQILVNLRTASNCNAGISLGNDVQMMSWDSDVVSFRCNNTEVYYYRISTNTVTQINVSNVNYVAPMPGASGNLFYHRASVYDNNGNLDLNLNSYGGEHSCLGKLSNGNDAYFAVTFAAGPNGGCNGNLVAHDLTTGACYEIISEALGYDYSQSGTHISSLAHKNTEGGWVAASMIGFEQDGQDLLDQELIIAKADQGNIKVCRIGHHRSDEDEFDYWGEPHAVISPSGTRVLFGSDWSGSEDGQSVDCYVVELPAYLSGTAHIETEQSAINIFPNPFTDQVIIKGDFNNYTIKVLNALGQVVADYTGTNSPLNIDLSTLGSGVYFVQIESTIHQELRIQKIIKE